MASVIWSRCCTVVKTLTFSVQGHWFTPSLCTVYCFNLQLLSQIQCEISCLHVNQHCFCTNLDGIFQSIPVQEWVLQGALNEINKTLSGKSSEAGMDWKNHGLELLYECLHTWEGEGGLWGVNPDWAPGCLCTPLYWCQHSSILTAFDLWHCLIYCSKLSSFCMHYRKKERKADHTVH